jgi:hypothetical protein
VAKRVKKTAAPVNNEKSKKGKKVASTPVSTQKKADKNPEHNPAKDSNDNDPETVFTDDEADTNANNEIADIIANNFYDKETAEHIQSIVGNLDSEDNDEAIEDNDEGAGERKAVPKARAKKRYNTRARARSKKKNRH